jgi:uncharacterized lipoprotein YddW (UPF0748 family)
MTRLALAITLIASAALGAQPAPAASPAARPVAPPIVREFRAAWVATVGNMDWPSSRDLPVAEQQRELLDLLDRAQQLRLNAIVFQVRPAADALYASKIEPWSEYLTGRMGRAPEPFWDPLAFAVTEAHKRGLELHAWFNPFRAHDPSGKSPVSSTHIMKRRPDLVRSYGPYKWLDPGVAEVRAYSTRVILDVVKRYDIDAVHIDDYFYPYRESTRRGGYLQFPDASSYRAYRRKGGKLDRDDWRRHNVDLFVEGLYDAVKKEKPWVKVGISPFGIWRPGYPSMVRGLDSYVEIFADSRKWLTNGWLDYVSPQLYWKTDAPQQPFSDLLRWWVGQNEQGRHVWPGLFTQRVAGSWPASEILTQVARTRAQDGATGNIHFSMKTLLEDADGVATQLASQVYIEPALVPASPWLERNPPVAPTARVETDSATGRTVVTLRPAGKARVWLWVVQAHAGEQWVTRIVPGAERRVPIAFDDASAVPDRVVVRAVDRLGMESEAVDAR